MSTTPRTIHYYNISFSFKDDSKPVEQFRNLFSTITKMSKDRDPKRYITYNKKSLFINEIKFHPTEKQIRGILRLVRQDALPMLMDTRTDETQDLELLEHQGLVESSHFIIDYSKKTRKLAFEYNQFGAKLADFCFYLQSIGQSKCNLLSVAPMYITKNSLGDILRKANMVSELTLKIHKYNIDRVSKVDTQMASTLKELQNLSDTDYVTLFLKYDIQSRQETKKANGLLDRFVKSFTKDVTQRDFFNILKVRAQNEDNFDKLETFDLLIDKVYSEIRVEKKPNYKTIVSDDMFNKMGAELIKKKII